MKTTMISLALVSNLVACVGGDNTAPDDVAFPKSCSELPADSADGAYTLFVDNNEAKPWTAYCVDLATDAKTYLTLPQGGDMNWSTFRDATGIDVESRFDKVRIDPISLQIDVGDHAFAISKGNATSMGVAITEMPYGVAMSCGGGFSTAQVSVGDTPFVIASAFDNKGDLGHAGHAEMWETNKTVEMWADGDCGYTASILAPAKPVNEMGGYAIFLSYR